jgi:hypothetical protein
VLDGVLYYALRSECSCLKHLLEADDIVVLNNFEDLLKALFFVVILICFNWRWSQENVQGKQPNPSFRYH